MCATDREPKALIPVVRVYMSHTHDAIKPKAIKEQENLCGSHDRGDRPNPRGQLGFFFLIEVLQCLQVQLNQFIDKQSPN